MTMQMIEEAIRETVPFETVKISRYPNQFAELIELLETGESGK